jgi:dihydroorotate dehydrogenase
MYSWIRPLLFRLDAERAHHLTLNALRLAGALPFGTQILRSLFDLGEPKLEVEAFGLKFKNRVGLAAGYDKNGVAIRGLGALGFGHIEVGTVTRLPQTGNPKPRVHRIPEAMGLINSMGFPNEGVSNSQLAIGYWRDSQPKANSQLPIRIGINIGKGKDTPIERAAEDYCELLQQVAPFADYVALNISSPNTMNLRQLQARETITSLLKDVVAVRNALPIKKPLLVKIAPDLNEAELDDVLDAIAMAGIDGVIATNTTIGREGLPSYAQSLKGGLSGAPLTTRSTEVIRYIAKHTLGKLPIIGVGGIMSPRDAIEKINAGATLVQVYTGMIYRGPAFIRQINKAMLRN